MSDKPPASTTAPAATFSFSLNVQPPAVMSTTPPGEPATFTGRLPLSAVRHLLSDKPLIRPKRPSSPSAG
jgi:hypothetical protein